jgi:2-phosphosulfolactate phosphatase
LGWKLSIKSLLEGATRAAGTVAIIDVFRAFTTAAVALANGASRIVMVSTVEEALAFRDAGIGQICMGEVQGRAQREFDFGNSPFEISAVDFCGKTVIQRTSAGTQGIVAANRADRLYAASFVTATTIARGLAARYSATSIRSSGSEPDVIGDR